jgi:hypothetical protein
MQIPSPENFTVFGEILMSKSRSIKLNVLGGTGYYKTKKMKLVLVTKIKVLWSMCQRKKKTLTWHFNPMVHDFTWAADKDYIHDVAELMVSTSIFCNKPPFQNWKIYNQKQITVGDLQQNCYYPSSTP